MDDPPHTARFQGRVVVDADLVVFDVDGTLVEHDRGEVVWEVLNRRYAGGSEINAARFRAFLAGELSYEQWVALDIQGWIQGGATRDGIEAAIRDELRPVPHAHRVVREIARRGIVTAVVSGTLDVVLDVLFPGHPFGHVFTNRLNFADDGRITAWNATPYDMGGKADALRMLAADLHVPMDRIAFVGDNLNDCAAMSLAGHPIAYDPKHDDVRAAARHVIPRGHLDLLLDLLPPCPRS